LLQEQFVFGIEDEAGEGAVQKALVNIGHEMAWSCQETAIVFP
jgi:hypothetical protein